MLVFHKIGRNFAVDEAEGFAEDGDKGLGVVGVGLADGIEVETPVGGDFGSAGDFDKSFVLVREATEFSIFDPAVARVAVFGINEGLADCFEFVTEVDNATERAVFVVELAIELFDIAPVVKRETANEALVGEGLAEDFDVLVLGAVGRSVAAVQAFGVIVGQENEGDVGNGFWRNPAIVVGKMEVHEEKEQGGAGLMLEDVFLAIGRQGSV